MVFEGICLSNIIHCIADTSSMSITNSTVLSMSSLYRLPAKAAKNQWVRLDPSVYHGSVGVSMSS